MQLSVQKALQRQGERLAGFRVELGLEPFEFCAIRLPPVGLSWWKGT